MGKSNDEEVKIKTRSRKRKMENLCVTFRPLVKQTTTRNLYITIYIYFLDGRLCEVGAVRRGIRIVRRWGLNFSMSGDDGRDNTLSVTTREVSWTAGSFFSELPAFCSIRRPYITFKLPRRDKDTPPQFLPISGDRDESLPLSLEWPVWSSSSGNNCHAVHRSLSSGASLKWDLHLVPYYQPSTPARFLSIIDHWDVSLPLSSEWQVWSSSSGNNYHAVHRSISSGASLFLRHSENFYLVSYCEPSCILQMNENKKKKTMLRTKRNKWINK